MSFWDSLFRLIFGRRAPSTPPTRSPPPPPFRPGPTQTAEPLPEPPSTPPMADVSDPVDVDIGEGAPVPGYLATLVARTTAPLTQQDYQTLADEFGCEREAIQAVAQVEAGNVGAFGRDGRPTILFEPHIFSQLTGHQHDAGHPTISHARGARPYPRTQAERYAQLTEAFGLDEDAALKSASWGKFQVLGRNATGIGYASVKDFCSQMAESEVKQLGAFRAYCVRNNLQAALRNKDWAAFARGYNGAAYRDFDYDGQMLRAYTRLKAGT